MSALSSNRNELPAYFYHEHIAMVRIDHRNAPLYPVLVANNLHIAANTPEQE
jgi:hypothetical protein